MPVVYRAEHTYTHRVKAVFSRTYEESGNCPKDDEDAQALQRRIHWLEEQMDRLELPPKSRKRRIYLGDHQSKQLELAAMLNEVCLIETKVKDFADDATMAHLREEKEDLTKRLAQALQIPQA